MIEDPRPGDIVTVCKGGGTGGTVIGLWADEETSIEWVILRVHEWFDEVGWQPSTALVPMMCERESLIYQ
ncbi:MAG TPA: hypothetical protein VF170_14840 [Planctomycetaceae bacterium]